MEATFAAGCFWGVEKTFSKVPGVLKTEVGYSGGHTKNPTYEQVCSGNTGHAETVRVEYDPNVISYQALLDVFWSSHNPTTINRQGVDVGSQYRSIIFFHSEEQHQQALQSKEAWQKSGKIKGEIVTEIMAAMPFYRAEEYHQHYLEKKG